MVVLGLGRWSGKSYQTKLTLSDKICRSNARDLRRPSMTQSDARILIIGGGFGGLFTALDLAGSGEVTLINNEDHFLFKPMLYEYLSGEVEAWHIAPDCEELLDDKTRFIRGVVTNIDLDAQT